MSPALDAALLAADKLDAAVAEAVRLRAAWLRVIQAENACAVTGQPCDAKRCGCAAEQAMLVREADADRTLMPGNCPTR